MSRRRQNRNIGFRAFEDTDRDILDWWESMPSGERSAALRGLIRAAIGGRPHHGNGNGNGHTPLMEQVATDTAWLRSAFMELPTYLEGLLSRMPAAPTEARTVDPEGQPADQQAVERRRANMKRSTW